MEAFIIADKVIDKQHMQYTYSRPKYIKKYDVSPATLHIRKISHLNRKPIVNAIPLNAPRTKQILFQISQTLNKQNSRVSTPQLQRYFTLTNQGPRQNSKKSKKALLIKKFQPHPQHYDADFRPVSRRAPSWGLTGKRNVAKKVLTSTHLKQSDKENALNNNFRASNPLEMGDFFDHYLQKIEGQSRAGFGQLLEAKLHYSPTDLCRCTTNIFKKYNLDRDPYFTKFLADIQNQSL